MVGPALDAVRKRLVALADKVAHAALVGTGVACRADRDACPKMIAVIFEAQ
jgi:hypothetical protein